LYCFVFISVYVMLLLAVLVTIGPSAFNKFGLVFLVIFYHAFYYTRMLLWT